MPSIEYNHKGYRVPPRSRDQLHAIAEWVRKTCHSQVDKHGRLDIVSIIEHSYEHGYQIVDNPSFPLGLTNSEGVIFLRSDVYDGMCNGDGRPRFTGAHELAHGLTHKDYIGMAREADSNTKIYENSEWQANEFAGALLLPNSEIVKNFKNYSLSDFVEIYGISYECAEIRIEKAQKSGII